MYSLNVPLPGAVTELAAEIGRGLSGACRREEYTLVCKRLGTADRTEFQRLAARAREAVAGTPPFELRVTGLGCFRDPPTGPAPVVYLAVDSPELERLHARLTEAFDPVAGLEGESYVPHVTVARGGDPDLAGLDRDPGLRWTATELLFWDAGHGRPAGTVSLPA